jgi:DNA-binding beta-propeller fold protein YncE
VLPQLRKLEEKYASELVVVGVHSGKYHAERVTERIRHASFRLDSVHPIVNDRQFRVWRSYAVSAWPTLVVVDPRGYVAGAHVGEFTAEMLTPFIDSMIAAAESNGTLDRTIREFHPDASSVVSGGLRYPGKIAINGSRIALSDSGNNRIILGSLSGDGQSLRVEREVGGRKGFDDGANASFDFPQGLFFGDDKLYVADAGNHAIRAIDLRSFEVSTSAGNGQQLRNRRDRENRGLSSPWDVVVRRGMMYIAMAGVHQIWSMDLPTGELAVHAGTGAEDIHDGTNENAALAQPMGITAGKNALYFADAESSAVRATDFTRDGETRTIVGTGLFDFGDVDGTGESVRMQHQQGIAISPDGRLLLADSYNDSLKWVDPVLRSAETWIRELNEPGGVASGSTHAYVADTNAHRILAVSYATGEVRELRLQ